MYTWYPYTAPTHTPTNNRNLNSEPKKELEDVDPEASRSLSRGAEGSARIAVDVETEMILVKIVELAQTHVYF